METNFHKALYEAIVNHDTKFDGHYYIGIVTTGIFCFPSCRSRTPRPENIRIYRNMEEAKKAGFRPCKRCRPDNPNRHGPDAEITHRVIDIIQRRYRESLTLSDLAEELNISKYHLQRVFKRFSGITPSEQLLNTRMNEAKELLRNKEWTIAEIAKLVGFRSTSHFSSVFQKRMGCAPKEFRESGG
jgi:AraC family transcriptional regulator of adaptative response / methylphosphotriester-DNA alkyltransferase methyltransferase